MENITISNTAADEIASTTPATETAGEPVIEQAPSQMDTPVTPAAPITESPAKKPYVVEKTWPGLECSALKEPDDPAELFDSAAASEPAPAIPGYLPADYLANGYFATTDKGTKYLRPEFVGEYAEIMAKLLADMKPSVFNGLLREMKRSKKTVLPFEARLTAAAEMLPKAMALVHRKKAPALLVSFIKDNLDHIQNDDDWYAYLRHLEAVAAFLTAQKGGDN